jgi:hypothetical protein
MIADMKTTMFTATFVGLASAGVALADFEQCYGPLLYKAKLPSIPSYRPFSYNFDSDDCHSGPTAYLHHTTDIDSEAVCLDGSSGSFYVHEVENAVGTLIMFDSVGLCVTEEECAERAQLGTGLCRDYGGSKDENPFEFPNESSHIIFHSDGSTNPLFHAYNKVLVNDCDGGAFSSSRGKINVGDSTIFLNGVQIAKATFDMLDAKGLTNGAVVLASRGYASIGISSWISQYAADRYGSTKNLIYSGYYPEYSGEYSSIMNPYEHSAFTGSYEDFWNTAASTHGFGLSYPDILTANSLDNISQKTMLMGSSFDPWMLSSAFGFDYSQNNAIRGDLVSWASNFDESVKSTVNGNVDVYGAFTFCQFTNNLMVKAADESVDMCEEGIVWANQEHEAYDFNVETAITIGQGAVSIAEAMSLFVSNVWPSQISLFLDSGSFGTSECQL